MIKRLTQKIISRNYKLTYGRIDEPQKECAAYCQKQLQVKIAIAFLFGQLHFNNVTLHAFFYGGHLVMRSKRCSAVQNHGITLILLVKNGTWVVRSWFGQILSKILDC